MWNLASALFKFVYYYQKFV